MKPAKSTSARNTGAVAIFVGALLVVVFVVGLISQGRPDAFIKRDRYDFTLEQFVSFCQAWWLPAGIIGIPVLVISLIRSLVQESRKKD